LPARTDSMLWAKPVWSAIAFCIWSCQVREEDGGSGTTCNLPLKVVDFVDLRVI
jgi:hypothetical protein